MGTDIRIGISNSSKYPRTLRLHNANPNGSNLHILRTGYNDLVVNKLGEEPTRVLLRNKIFKFSSDNILTEADIGDIRASSIRVDVLNEYLDNWDNLRALQNAGLIFRERLSPDEAKAAIYGRISEYGRRDKYGLKNGEVANAVGNSLMKGNVPEWNQFVSYWSVQGHQEDGRIVPIDLTGLYLPGAVLPGINLSYVRLWNANLRGANLDGACLFNVDAHNPRAGYVFGGAFIGKWSLRQALHLKTVPR